MTLTGRRLWVSDDDFCPRWSLTFWYGWTSWLVGVELDHHPREWRLTIRLGPFGLGLEHVA